MKIKLICPSFYTLADKVFRTKIALLPPLSIYYLAGFISNKHEVSTIDDTIEEIDFEAPVDLVALTSTTISIRRVYEIADEYRLRNVRVVIGGIHVTMLPDEALEHADAIVIGEGEDSWPELIADAENGHLKKIYQCPPRPTLEGLPFPRFDLIKASNYFHLPFRKNFILPICTSRGCPHNCSFCSVTKFWGKKIRFRPIPEVVEEIKKCGSDTIFFTDDNFLANPKRALELCKAIEPLHVKFFCQIDTLTQNRKELFKAMGKAGCFMALVGFERIDAENLNVLQKGFNAPVNYTDLIGSLHKNSINVYASLILGLEGDTTSTVQKTVDFLIKNKIEMAAFFPITPFPGTDFFNQLKQSGQLVDDLWWLHSVEDGKEGLVKYPNNSLSEYHLCRYAMKNFFSGKSIFRRFRNIWPYRFLPLLLNLHTRIKSREAKDSCVL